MIKKKGINLGGIKVSNRSAILKVLKDNGAMSRKDIAELLNLTPAAVTILTSEMKDEDILLEVGELEEEDKRAGRKKILIDINYDYRYVIGINIEWDYINLGIANTKGETIISKSLVTDKTLFPSELLKNIANECVAMLWKADILKQKILGVGVGILGYVDKQNGVSKHAYGLWNQEVPIKEILEKELGLEVVVDNNVRALALGEIDYGSGNDINNMLFVKYGPGIGTAVVINKEIYYGASNKSGELGHSIMNINGKSCKCGKKGCLETIASQDAIIRTVKSIFSKEKTPILYEKCHGNVSKIDINRLSESAVSGEEKVVEIIRIASRYMALAIVNAAGIIDPEKVVLYGKFFESEVFYNEFIKYIKEVMNTENLEGKILLSKLNNRENYIGGGALAIREFLFNTGGTII